MLKVIAILLISLSLSCGRRPIEFNSQPSLELKSSSFKTVGTDSVRAEKNVLKGNGLVVSTAPLKNGKDKNYNYQLKFTLKEGGSLRLRSHAQTPEQQNGRYTALKGGIDVFFVRAGNQLRMNVSGKEVNPEKLKSIKADQVINISLDIHNDEDHQGESHLVLILPEDKKIHIHGKKGEGQFWGLELNQAEVLDASVGEAKIEG